MPDNFEKCSDNDDFMPMIEAARREIELLVFEFLIQLPLQAISPKISCLMTT